MNTPDWKIEQRKQIEQIYKSDYKKYSKILYKLRIPIDQHDDVIQFAFLMSLNTNIKINNMNSCMRRAVFNAGLIFKRNKFNKNRSSAFDFERYTTRTPETELLTMVEKTRLNNLIETLAPKQKFAVKFGIMEDNGYKGVANITNTKYNTAKANCKWGIDNLRDEVKTWDIPQTYESEYFIREEDNA